MLNLTRQRRDCQIDREEVLRREFAERCDVHPSAFHAVLLPGYRIMGWDWAEQVVRAWRKP